MTRQVPSEISRVLRIATEPISGSERQGFLAAGYVEVGRYRRFGRFRGDVLKIVDVGPNWIDVEASEDWRERHEFRRLDARPLNE